MTVPFAVNPLLTGRIVARVGPRAPVLAGLGLLTAAGLLLGGGVLAGASYPSLLAGLVCAGFGVSFALPALVAAVVTAAPEGMAGAAGGLLNATRQAGATLGVAILGAFVTTAPADDGTAYAFLASSAVCAVAAVLFARRPSSG